MNWCEEHDHFKRTCPWCELSEKEAEIERLRVKLTKAVEELQYVRLALSIAHDHGYDTEDRDIEKTIDRIDKSIRIIIGGETDATQTSSRS